MQGLQTGDGHRPRVRGPGARPLASPGIRGRHAHRDSCRDRPTEPAAAREPGSAEEDLRLGVLLLGDQLELRRCPRSAAPGRSRCRAGPPSCRSRPRATASIACSPKRVASQRSNAVGVPPRCTWPSTTARASLPVRSSISLGEPVADAAEPDVAERVGLQALTRVIVAALGRHRALGDDDDRGEAASAKRDSTQRADLLDVERLLGDQHRRSAPPAMPGVQRDPAGVPAHHLDHEDPVVGLGGGVQPVDRLDRDVDRGVEAEGEVGAGRGRCRSSWARRRR